MKNQAKFRFHPLVLNMACAGTLAMVYMPFAQADEISDLKTTVKQLQDRIDRLDQNAKSASPSATATPAPAVVSDGTGLQWKFYGRADLGYNSATVKSADGSIVTNHRFGQGLMTSRLGVNGAWVFNPDYKAIFGLETGIYPYSGSAGGADQNNTNSSVLFNRGATLGLASSRLGSIEGGTMYMAPFWVAAGADQASAKNYGASDFSSLYNVITPAALGRYLKDPVATNVSKTSTQTGSNAGTGSFYGNAVRYRTPTYAGFSGELSYSMGQQASAATPLKNDGRTWAGNVLYNAGPFFAGYAHMDYLQDNDVAASGLSDWVTRDQVTDIWGAHYRVDNFTLGAAFTTYRVSNAGGYRAKAYGLSAGYDIAKNRIEASWGHITYAGANAGGAYGSNLGDGQGCPKSDSASLGYLYNLQSNLTLYTYYNKVFNNDHANLSMVQYRNDNSTKYYGYDPSEWTVGMLYTF